VIKWPVTYARFFNVLTVFFKSKKHDVLRFFGVVAHVFSNTILLQTYVKYYLIDMTIYHCP